MRAVIQRVRSASVSVSGKIINQINRGLVIFLGVERNDTEQDARYLAEKILKLRIFEDDEGKMNLSLLDTGGKILAISQFTLYGDCRKGLRPSFSQAAGLDLAKDLYEYFLSELKRLGGDVYPGVFQEHMLVGIENDGPVTMLLDSQKLF